ncbi:MAG: fibronectin type III domain-containing protein [Pseudomonadota bacterium]
MRLFPLLTVSIFALSIATSLALADGESGGAVASTLTATQKISANAAVVSHLLLDSETVPPSLAPTYSISAAVTGLGASKTLVLQNKGAEQLSFTTNTSKPFATKLASGGVYAVTVKTQPSGQTCTVNNGSGTVASSNVSNVTVACVTPDVTAPSVPTALTLSSKTSTTLNLTWTASSDNIAVTGYDVLLDGTKVGTSVTTAYSYANLTAATQYSLTVKAYDAAGNRSGASTALLATTHPASNVNLVLSENFDSATLPTALGIWSGGTTITLSTNTAENYGGSTKSLKASYPALTAPNGAVYPGGTINLASYNTDRAYIRFRAKMPHATHGLKFIKVFGKNPGNDNYANTTFGLDYTGVENGLTGSMYAASYGDGAGVTNDTASYIALDGNAGMPSGRAKGLPGYSINAPKGKNWKTTDWGTGWHLFELYVKFNSGTTALNEKNDGEITVRIDNELYVEAKGLFNRHYTNQHIDRIEILGWSQTGTKWVQDSQGNWTRINLNSPAFDIWYDNVQVSLDGFATD